MNRTFRTALIVIAILALLWLLVYWLTSTKAARFDAQKLEQSRDNLKTHNAQFLGRDRVAARYKLILTGDRGYTCFASMRLPQSERKLPALLILHEFASDTDFFKAVEIHPRANELAFVGLNVTNCFGSPTKESMNVYGAAQLCVDYVHKHFVMDTNQVFVAGLGVGSLYALPAAYLDRNDVRAVAITLSAQPDALPKIISGAAWAQGLIQDTVLVLQNSSSDANEWWQKNVGPFAVHSFVQSVENDPTSSLGRMTDWVLGPPRVISVDTLHSEPGVTDQSNVRKLKMK